MTRASWLFVAPALAVIVCFFYLPAMFQALIKEGRNEAPEGCNSYITPRGIKVVE